MGRRADAAFDLLHAARPRYPRQLRHPASRHRRLARLRAAQSPNAAKLFALVQEQGVTNATVVITGGAPAVARTPTRRHNVDDDEAAPAPAYAPPGYQRPGTAPGYSVPGYDARPDYAPQPYYGPQPYATPRYY
jgi:hypothetical protein